MIKLNKNSGFSLAESLISMMLLVLTILLTMTSITKKKSHPTVKSSISGMYACWEKNGNLHQARYDGNRQVEDSDVASCTFEMDRRTSEYTIYAVGSRKCDDASCVDGQVATKFVQKEKNRKTTLDEEEVRLEIELGNTAQNGGITTVREKGNKILTALGGILKNTSKLVDGNIVLSGAGCKLAEIPDGLCDTSAKFEPRCEVVNSVISRIKNKNPNKTGIKINCVKTISVDCDGKSCKESNTTPGCNIEYIGDLTKVNDEYQGDCVINKDDSNTEEKITVKVKVQEYDSTLKADINSDIKKSEFVKQLKMIPLVRQNGLTNELLKYYQENNDEKSGVVLIIW